MSPSEAVNLTYVKKYESKYRTAKANLIDVVHRFHSEEVCRDYLRQIRWPNGVVCHRCRQERR
jgi:hypothetical protein